MYVCSKCQRRCPHQRPSPATGILFVPPVDMPLQRAHSGNSGCRLEGGPRHLDVVGLDSLDILQACRSVPPGWARRRAAQAYPKAQKHQLLHASQLKICSALKLVVSLSQVSPWTSHSRHAYSMVPVPTHRPSSTNMVVNLAWCFNMSSSY